MTLKGAIAKTNDPYLVYIYVALCHWKVNFAHEILRKITEQNKRGNRVCIVYCINKYGGINWVTDPCLNSKGHDDVIKWKHFPRCWPYVRGIHRPPVNSPHKGQWRGALMFSLICVWMNGWVNNDEAGDLRRHRAHYDVTVVRYKIWVWLIDYIPQFHSYVTRCIQSALIIDALISITVSWKRYDIFFIMHLNKLYNFSVVYTIAPSWTESDYMINGACNSLSSYAGPDAHPKISTTPYLKWPCNWIQQRFTSTIKPLQIFSL